MIILKIDTTETFIVEFLHKNRRRWHARKYTWLGVTLIDPMFIEESEEKKSYKVAFCGSTDNVEGRKEGEPCWGWGNLGIFKHIIDQGCKYLLWA